MTSDRYQTAVSAIDNTNREDPRSISVKGRTFPHELYYSKRLSEWVLSLSPNASEALRLAARGQHIQRWSIPRDSFPRGLNGYMEWRERLKNLHAEKMSGILRQAGYSDEFIRYVLSLVRKENFPDDPESRVLEDALCLVFLEFQLAGFIEQHPKEKVIDILQKTWAKMTPEARRIAVDMKHAPKVSRLLEEVVNTSE